MEIKKRYGRIQDAPYSLDLAPFDFAFFPQLHRICMESCFGDCTESDLIKDMAW